ncbi:MAG: ferritin [Chloroflexi bacterium]|nr:ferritin [Chloroflexota bacterium]
MKPEETRKLIDALNQDVSLELGAVIQYLWHHYMAEGMESPAVIDLFEKLAREEMGHLEGFAERVVDLGGEPNSQMAPIKKGGDLKKMVRDDMEGERNAIQVYKGHIRLAAELGDTTTRLMLEEVVSAEEGHAALWETTLGIKPGE